MEKMKKPNNAIILIAGILLFLASFIFDEKVNLLFKGADIPFLNTALSIITNFGVVIAFMLALPSIIFYKKNKESRKAVYLLWLAFLAAFAAAFILKLIVLRQRPAEAFTFPLINIINYSFPSMHAMVVFSLLPVISSYIPKQKWLFIYFAFLAAFSRIYLGFHFLSDVVFGAFAGYFIGSLLLNIFKKKKWIQ